MNFKHTLTSFIMYYKATLVALFLLLNSSICKAQSFHKIEILKEIPSWGNNLSTINKGKWSDYVLDDNPVDQFIALVYWGDRELGIKKPFEEFLYLKIDDQNVFLKFIEGKKIGKRLKQVYGNEHIKIILDYDGIVYNRSGNGQGGDLYFYFDNKLQKKYDFFYTM